MCVISTHRFFNMHFVEHKVRMFEGTYEISDRLKRNLENSFEFIYIVYGRIK